MKHQYFGDVNDYRKYGLLRAIRSHGIPVASHWMLTPDDGTTDGKFIAYLEQPDKFRHYDPDLFDWLAACLAKDRSLGLQWFAEHDVIDLANQLLDHVPRDPYARQVAQDCFLEQTPTKSLVFFDPDNGIEVQSVPAGRRNSVKFVYWPEIEQTFALGHSLLIYQHYPRINRQAFELRIMAELARRLGSCSVATIRTPRVAFFLAAQPDQAAVAKLLCASLSHWKGQMSLVTHPAGNP